MRIPSHQLSGILSSSELVLMVALGVGCQRIFPGYLAATSAEWMRRHMRFGAHSILGGLAVEMNTRVDVLVLGLFTSDAAVGIYSFAAFFVEGILQLPQLARRILDPVITMIVVGGERARLYDFMRKGRNLGAIFMVLVGITGVLSYPVVARIIGGSSIAAESWDVFVILMIGTCIFGAYAAFSGLFSQAGLPLVQSHLNVLILATNMLLNLALAPFYGVYGAAIATSLSFIIATLLFRRLVRLHFGIRL
jgi:O-antigen/teichoic acid export membrane protein